jgi:hypothetical protein
MLADSTKRKLAGVAIAATIGTGAVLVAASPALAYNFPFNGRCGQNEIYDNGSATWAYYHHKDGSKLYYQVYWGPNRTLPPNPNDPKSPANWASCTK